MRSPETSAATGEEARLEMEGENGAPAPGSRWRSILLGVVVVAVVAAGGYWYYDTHIRGYDATDDAFIDGNRVGITSRVLGRITFLACDEGDTVTQGSVRVSTATALVTLP